MRNCTLRHCTWSLLGLAALAGGCGKEEAQHREVVRPVKMFHFGDAARRLQLTYPGRVYANLTVEVGFEVTGKVVELPVSRGEEVKKGQLLAKVDQRDFANALKAAEATQAEADATYDRLKSAYEKNAVARQQVDEALARTRVAKAEVEIRKKALADTEIRADFDGVVADRYVENYQNVVAKQPILSLQDISRLEIRINVPESDMNKAGKTGQDPGKMTARFSVVPDRTFELSVKEFATQADPITQTYLVTLVMPRPDDVEIFPGMTASVTWEPLPENVGVSPTVPAIAVGGEPGRSAWVWLVDPATSTVSRRTVEAGQLVDGDMIEIESGLKPGEAIAAVGVYHLEEGMKVREYAAQPAVMPK